MVLSFIRSLIGTVPAGYEILEYIVVAVVGIYLVQGIFGLFRIFNTRRGFDV